MAITTYNDLAAEIRAWSARSDSTFSARIETFVALHEERMYNGAGANAKDPLFCDGLSAPEQETEFSVSVTNGVGAVPAAISTARTVKRDGDLVGLDYMSPRQFARRNSEPTGGDPGYYTQENGLLKITPSFTGTIQCDGYKKFPTISVENQSNILLVTYPLLYLSGCLFEAFSFMQEVELAMGHFARYRAQVSGINQSANSVRFGGGPLRVRTRQAMP